jgi:hypothetical protein
MKKNKVIVIALAIALSISLGFNIYIVIPKHKHIWGKWETVSYKATTGILWFKPQITNGTGQTKKCLECGKSRFIQDR